MSSKSSNLIKISILMVILACLLFLLVGIVLFSETRDKHDNPKIAIIGAGLAGLSAAIEASNFRSGAEIHIFEKYIEIQGNSVRASSGINGVHTLQQTMEGVEDSYDLFLDDSIRSSKDDFDERLVEILVEESTSAVNFLTSFGIDLGTLSQCGGHSAKRTHRNDPNILPFGVGKHIMMELTKEISGRKDISVHLDYPVIAVERINNGNQFKISAGHRGETFLVDKVIITTGGFGFDHQGLIKDLQPELENLPTTSGPWCTGDGIRLGISLGADTTGLSHIQVHPTGLAATETFAPMPYMTTFDVERNVPLASEAIRGYGALLIDKTGTRFVNELGNRDHLTEKIMEVGEDMFGDGRKVVRMIFNQETFEGYGRMGVYAAMNLLKVFSDFQEYCETENIDCMALEKTLNDYNSQMENNGVDEFGKTVYPTKLSIDDHGPVYQLYITPTVHYTMGGLRINENAQVLDSFGMPIEGVFSAGEVTGGIHGVNRLAGNSLLDCVVYGRIAGRNAME